MKRILAGIGVSLTWFTSALISQGSTSSISGTITDTTGAAISGAPIELRLASIGALWQTKSNETGRYAFVNMPPGPYQFTVNVPWFKKYEQELDLKEKGQLRIDVKLEAGTPPEHVPIDNTLPALK